jgi:Bacterial Ig-like domain
VWHGCEHDPMRRARKGLLRVAAVSLVAMAVGPAGTAIAAPPNVTMTSPLNGSVSNSQTPSFSGLAEEHSGEVTLRIYEGPNTGGTVIQELSTLLLSFGAWSLGPAERLEDGTYTAQATQTNLSSETGTSSPVTFTVDTAAPRVTLSKPPSPSSTITPSFTGSASDTTPITVQIHTGATAKGVVVSTATATGTGTGWTSGKAIPALSSGQYTAVATQPSSLLGNPAGKSEPMTFTVTPPLVSTPAVLPPAAPPAAAETINVVAPRVSLMQPFPVVRIVGIDTASGVKLRLLKVQQLPAGAWITVRCKGRGCPLKSARRVAVSNKRGVAPVEVPRFERSLRFGVTLEILVSKPGEIGKYTRFAIRRGKLPERLDMCLDPAGVKPLVCPSS